MKGFIAEFKAFAIKGNAIDFAVGVVIGAAFGKIVSSIVDDLVMPIVAVITGGIDFSDMAWQIPGTEALLRYGAFANVVLNFLIVAFAIFLVVRQLARLKREAPAAPAAPAPTPEDVLLLREIRDALNQR